MSYLRQFWDFLYDFLVGDSWELFVGPIVALGVAWLLVQAGVAALIVALLLFAMILAVAAANLFLALRHSV
ncbi:MAG: hypothetical protein QOH61_1708, partial [Chloroflexota bacterium]|nr:hypothetical protein [Chloroflexota bacterium]